MWICESRNWGAFSPVVAGRFSRRRHGSVWLCRCLSRLTFKNSMHWTSIFSSQLWFCQAASRRSAHHLDPFGRFVFFFPRGAPNTNMEQKRQNFEGYCSSNESYQHLRSFHVLHTSQLQTRFSSTSQVRSSRDRVATPFLTFPEEGYFFFFFRLCAGLASAGFLAFAGFWLRCFPLIFLWFLMDFPWCFVSSRCPLDFAGQKSKVKSEN